MTLYEYLLAEKNGGGGGGSAPVIEVYDAGQTLDPGTEVL